MNPESQTEILIESLCKSFNGKDVLQGITLRIDSGEIVAIVGGSGCGKTVLMNLILGQYSSDKGKILVLDHAENTPLLRDLAEFNEFEIDNIHRHWGVVFQRNALFSGSVYENIALWLREVKGMNDEEIVPIAEETLRAVGLPDDRDFLLGDHGNLSGGMAKRLAVARALSMDPSVIFYDEPTTGLDPVNSAQIHDLIIDRHNQNLSDGTIRTSIIITHDKDLLNRSRPRTIMLHKGKVYFDGPFSEFEASESEIIRPYFDLMPILDQRYLVESPQIPDLSKRKGLII